MTSGPITSDIDSMLAQQIEDSYSKKDNPNPGYVNIFRTDVKFNKWRCEGDRNGKQHWIDIIPYVVGGNDPTATRGLEKGKIAYKLELWVHRKLGLGGDYVCLYYNYGKPCPVCEYVAKLKKDWNENKELIKKYSAKQRVLYNIICRDSDEEVRKGIQVWEVAHFFMEAKLIELAKRPAFGLSPQEQVQTKGFTPFPSLQNGRHIGFTVKVINDNFEFLAHSFQERKAPLSADLKDKTYCLDELIRIPTYEEINNAFRMGLTTQVTNDRSDIPSPMAESDITVLGDNPTSNVNVDKVCAAKSKGGEFGKTTDEYENCFDCEYHNDCGNEYTRRNSM